MRFGFIAESVRHFRKDLCGKRRGQENIQPEIGDLIKIDRAFSVNHIGFVFDQEIIRRDLTRTEAPGEIKLLKGAQAFDFFKDPRKRRYL